MLNMERLRTFVFAAERLNFTVAARDLHLSQPAVSQHIRELETELELTLFERRGRSLALTPAGERLRPMAKSLLRDLDRVGSALADLRGAPQGILRIGASSTLGIYLLPHAMGHFTRLYPGIRLTLQVGNRHVLARAIHDSDVDVVLVKDLPAAGTLHGWARTPFMTDEIILIVPPKHPWAQRGRIALNELGDAQFILRQSQSVTRQLVLGSLADAGFDPERLQIRFEHGHTEGLKQAVMAGLGVAFVSRYAVATEIPAGLITPVAIEGMRITRPLWMLRMTPEQPATAEQAFCDMLSAGEWLPEGFGEYANYPRIS